MRGIRQSQLASAHPRTADEATEGNILTYTAMRDNKSACKPAINYQPLRPRVHFVFLSNRVPPSRKSIHAAVRQS
jgi:hypothetical protein